MTNLQLADVTRVTALPAVVDAVQPVSNIESDEEYAKAAVAFDTVLQNAKDSMDKID